MRRLLLMVAVATVLATSVSFCASRWLASRPIVTIPPLKEALHLTEEQARQVDALDREYRTNLDECCKSHCAARFELGNELGKPSVDSAKANSFVDRMCAAQTDIERATLAHILRVREVLTPAQREEYAKLINRQVCTACPMGMHQP